MEEPHLHLWKAEYDTGVQRIDYQHRYFLQLIDWLLHRLLSSETFRLKSRYIDEVMHYARFHFLSEENYMKDHGYPERARHEQLHASLMKELNYKVSQLEFGDIDARDFVSFLMDWFMGHTAGEDKKIARYVQERAAPGLSQ